MGKGSGGRWLLARGLSAGLHRLRWGWHGRDRRGTAADQLGGHQATDSERAVDVTHAALDLAIRAGDLLLSAGLSASEVVNRMRRIAGAYGLGGVHIDVAYNAITASHLPGPDNRPITYSRVVQPRDTDYSQVRNLFDLSNDIQRGLPLPDAIGAFERIWSWSHPYRAWITQVATAGVAAAAVLRFSIAWQVIACMFVVAWLVDRMLEWLQRRGLPPFFRQLAGALVITIVAAAISKAVHPRWFFGDLNGRSSLLVVGGIIMLVANTETAIVAASQDAIDEFYVTASARIIEVTMNVSGIIAGLVIGIRLATALDMPIYLAANPFHRGPAVAQVVGSGITAACFVIASYADVATIVLAAAVSCFGWVIYAGAFSFGLDEILARSIAALIIAASATLFTRDLSVPGFAVVNAAVLQLVPGLILYAGLLDFIGTPVHPSTTAGARILFTALGIALGIAAGASLGTWLGRPIIEYARKVRADSGR